MLQPVQWLQALGTPEPAWRRARHLSLVLVVMLGGCIVVPHTPPSETRHDLEALPHPEQVRLSVGPRRFLEDMTAGLRELAPRVEFTDGQLFIDVVAPESDLSLARLLDPDGNALLAHTATDFLVLLGQPEDEILDEWGEVLVAPGLIGAMRTRASTRYSAAVIDLQTRTMVEQLTTTSTGTDAGVGFIYGVFISSNTAKSARQGVLRNIAATLNAARPAGPIRVVLLAREPLLSEQDIAAQIWASEMLMRRSPPYPYQHAAEHPRFSEPPPLQSGAARIVLYRSQPPGPYHQALAIMTRSPAGDYELVRFWDEGYYVHDVSPGDVTLWIPGQPQGPLTLHLQARETRYVQNRWSAGWRATRGELEVVDPGKGRSAVMLCRQTPTTREILTLRQTRAEAGYVFDQLELADFHASGVAYAPGESLPRDVEEAFKWYAVILSTDGVIDWVRERATRGRDALAAAMTSEQIAAGNRRAAAWHASFHDRVRALSAASAAVILR